MLILPIKKKWYDLIHSGEKKEEYRKLSPYYETRFKNLWQGSLIGFAAKRNIIFRNGYSRKSPSFIATVTLDIGEGKPEWGAKEGKHYYILKIHSINELPWWIGKRCNDCGNEKCKKLGTLQRGHDCALWQEKKEADKVENKTYGVEVINRGNCILCGKKLTEGLLFCKECENKRQKVRMRKDADSD